MTLQRALLSVSDKTGLIELAQALHRLDIELLSTGGTAQVLREAKIPVRDVSNFTGFPEMLDGRVKTLHPKIHGGLLGNRDIPSHQEAMARHGIDPIDLVVVNLYPFRETIAQPGVTLEEAIENIDIGGPAMVRSAAKNHAHVAVVTDPADYPRLLDELEKNRGSLSAATRFDLAVKAFSHTAEYDGAIATYLSGLNTESQADGYPERLHLSFVKHQSLRYGENPHQGAAFYRDPDAPSGVLSHYRQLQGKPLSYNNIADADTAWDCVRFLDAPACVIVKHANPCGVALGDQALDAYQRAYATDPTSAYGGIIAFNRTVDETTVEALQRQFVEVLIAPEFTSAALQRLAQKANVRVLQLPQDKGLNRWDMKRVGGGLLVQTPDSGGLDEDALKVVTQAAPTGEQWTDLRLAFHVAHYVKSNAVVFCGQGRTLGIGAGQMSRVDSTRIAQRKAEDAGLSLQGSVAASDAFFPFRDGLDVLARAGARAVIQPGGSLRDSEVIAAADEQGVAMVLTGIRHFRH
ncbi:bifunctional phosphoribosylaminoimidazolecarboxamide formyltransferase/IMP cyclohydrolase [Ferrovum sp.]|jgi:phosphoribosylaminoimidazolecarboxamide formyltransferase/IMP cyclohydrolase|uniref:bifunctional phosphoribosylaminoimidazolecarboxamide formyltransferase/IMP cyclohydrolase n=1 Tax=Ferrovum sp. TaxID=2609467 RepID=UPI00260E4634|nr:bifunctional phosphoribosylaminoimidazolecarboxamide formyltransferase/IMP cyclohydrolase [Ferrovum sp.]